MTFISIILCISGGAHAADLRHAARESDLQKYPLVI
jgi:hypothetical protein